MPHHGQSVIQVFGGSLERQHRVFKGARSCIGNNRVDTRLRVRDQLANSRFHMLGPNPIERDVERNMKQWIVRHLTMKRVLTVI